MGLSNGSYGTVDFAIPQWLVTLGHGLIFVDKLGQISSLERLQINARDYYGAIYPRDQRCLRSRLRHILDSFNAFLCSLRHLYLASVGYDLPKIL